MKLLSLVIFLFAFAAEAREAPDLLGHNLSQTSHVLKKGQCTAGLLHAGCGVNDRLTLGFSPWLIMDYAMYSFAARYKAEDNKKFAKAYQFNYFKTYKDISENRYAYEMEAVWTALVYSRKYNSHFTTHYNIHLNYYIDEKMPFSLRRPYEDPTPIQLNTTGLLEITLYRNWFIQGELGLLDIANTPLHFHGGASLGKRWSSGYFYFGFTFTPTIYSLFDTTRADYQQQIRRSTDTYEDEKDSWRVAKDYSIHPEMTAQFFF